VLDKKNFINYNLNAGIPIFSSKNHSNKRLELEFTMQPAGGFSGNPVKEEMNVGLGGDGKLNKLHELLLFGFRHLS
jgi:hypothetical protein